MIKVLQVVGADASDAVRARVAAICTGLDPAKFDVSRIDLAPNTTLFQLRRLIAEKRPNVVHPHAANARAAAWLAGVKKTIDTVPNAYLGDFPEPLAHDGLVAGSCGRMTRVCNTDAWVLLAQRLTDSRNGVKCAWIGGGKDEATTLTHLANMNLLMKVSVSGWLPADQAREKLRGLDLFVQFSSAGAGTASILEAMALGLPVVASDIPAHRGLVVDGVTGFLVGDEIKLLERCQQLLDDEPIRRRLGAAGRDRVRSEFSRERMLTELSRLYA
jgi:glycosyltransferase involved in cell wall biosynthesis